MCVAAIACSTNGKWAKSHIRTRNAKRRIPIRDDLSCFACLFENAHSGRWVMHSGHWIFCLSGQLAHRISPSHPSYRYATQLSRVVSDLIFRPGFRVQYHNLPAGTAATLDKQGRAGYVLDIQFLNEIGVQPCQSRSSTGYTCTRRRTNLKPMCVLALSARTSVSSMPCAFLSFLGPIHHENTQHRICV